MQEVNKLVERASALLADGTVDRVLGWKAGEFGYDVTPAVFRSAQELEQSFVWNDFCGANFSKYLVKETLGEGKVLVFLKPCDTYSFNQLLTEHRFNREKVYAIGVPCDGMLDGGILRDRAGELASFAVEGDTVTVETLYDGTLTLPRAELLPDRCVNCKSKKHVAYDELLGEDGDVLDSHRFDEVERLERMTADERYAFWQNELSRCIRCNACRDVCPACTCEKCVFDNPNSGVENKAAANSFEEKLFHIIRAFHVAGRCTDCGECSRVCPQHIPLHLLNRKFIHDIDRFYGDYQAGAEVGSRAPIVNYSKDDLEPSEAAERSGANA
ncbi:MAG: 4Fe-4S dicluster domain-containing protein [Candidatus Faecousia sp.]|uniref:4Fe-4S dicluster domain-containing protein n=1 Tax=Faecousia sp. TaxID=2952921 RepID=UPI002A8C6B6F|nr:4Fe-4S dicluster domain-containing protein [Candidatus Faecousia sp.]